VIEDCTDASGKEHPEVFQYNSNNVTID
jgi:hypothetical protein